MKNKIHRTGLLLLIGIIPFLGFAQTFEGNQKEIAVILENIKNFSTFYMNLDYDGIANSYTIDAKIMPPGADIITGREAIKQRWTLPNGVKIPYHKITPIEIKIVGKYAYDLGYYEGKTIQKNGNEVSWKGKYIIVWRKEHNNWKIYADVWNNINEN